MSVDEINKLLGNEFVNEFQRRMNLIMEPLREYIDEGTPMPLDKAVWERVVAKSIKNGKWVGAGKNIIDVRIDDKGVDVKTVSKEHKSRSTTEASMLQTFKEETKAYFNAKDENSIWNLFVNGWLAKVKNVKEYYLLGIVREKETLNCSLCCFKVIKTDLLYDPALCKFTSKSMKVFGLADPDFIETRVYSSKTRLEIKFKSKVWKDPNYCLQIYKF
jgi:hypothetical protein